MDWKLCEAQVLQDDLDGGQRASEMQIVQPLVINVNPPTESGIKVPG
jgi:hypothetical protein